MRLDRWAFGVVAPHAWSSAGGCEPSWIEAQLLVAGQPRSVTAQLRFFQIDRRRFMDWGRVAASWDEGVLQTITFDVVEGEHVFSIPAATATEALPAGDVECERLRLSGRIEIRRTPMPAERPLERISLRVENLTPWTRPEASREEVIAAAFASTHAIVGVTGGEPISLLDPPDWARGAATSCRTVGTFPVLVGAPGTQELMLAAPFIVHDHPGIEIERR